jgi:hypothetical protein
MEATIEAMKLPVAGQSSGTIPVPGSDVMESFNIGNGSVCTGPLSFTVLSDADLDGGGSEHLAYYVVVIVGANSALGGVRITWHRQVSPAPATATFNDVPTTDWAFRFIEALAKSGITSGCQTSPPLYCPDNQITRREMAVFLAVALGL